MRCAAFNGHLNIVEFLLQNYPDISVNAKAWALFDTASNGHLNIVKWLLQNYPDLAYSKETALFFASENGHLNIVKFLLQNYPDILNYAKRHALKLAILRNRTEVENYLRSQGVDEWGLPNGISLP